MQTNNKRNLIILLIVGAALYIFGPLLGAVMQPNNSIPYVAPQPNQQPAYQQPLYTAPDPAQQPQPAQYIIATSVPVTIIQPQPAPVIIDQVQAKDWSDEIKAVQTNLDNAVNVVEACAFAKMNATFENPPRLIDCGPAAENLLLAKQLMQDLQDAIQEGER